MAQDYPLAGMKVLDFTRVLAGPFASRILSDLGADVVKVEPPEGDVTRIWGAVKGGVPGYYHQQNVGKRDICVDLRAPGAKELIYELVAGVDIVMENYRPDVMPRLGLGYEDLRVHNPKLIFLSISGFGHNGPESHRPAYAPIVHAEAGLIFRQAERGQIKPTDLPLSVADTNASLHGLVGLLSAVIQRERTGEGQHIDIAMVDATLCTDDQIHYALEDSEHTGPMPNEIWHTGAGDVLISTDFKFLWYQLSTHGVLVDPADKETDLVTKIRLRRELVTQYLADLPDWEAVESAMALLNLAWGKVRNPSDIRDQATLAHRQSVVEVDDRQGGTRPIPQSPYRFSAAASGVRGVAPHRGEHNAEVLQDWLGYTADKVESLIDQGVLLRDEETLG
ncbi:MAG: CaiB/BaiF CoA-transferase family protein [Pseudomonadota bacterium]